MANAEIAIIGAGMAGLSCARRLADAGHAPVVLDKGRGIGGRLATRRAEGGLQFDHGAQYLTARSAEFAALLAAAESAGAVARWDDGAGNPRYVGTPSMTALAKHLGRGLDIRQGTEVTSLRERDTGWSVLTPAGEMLVDRVVVTAPAPQIGVLLGTAHPLAEALSDVQFDPCLTLMAAVAADAPRPFVSRLDPDDPIAWIAQDSSKPGRAAAASWVAQASPAWSKQHLELDRDEIAERMLPMVCDRLGFDRGSVLHAVAHRWRYARVSRPLGRPFLQNASGKFHAGGDWCLDARVEAAWQSGDAIARSILETA